MEESGITSYVAAIAITDFWASSSYEAVIQSPPLSEVTLKGGIYLSFTCSKDLTDLSLDATVSNTPECSFSVNIHFREDAVSCITQSHILDNS